MKRRNVIFAVLIAILVLGVGYATISSITLTVDSATATMTADPNNFIVEFKAQSTFTANPCNGSVTFTRNDEHTVTFALTGFSKKGQTCTITLPFENKSDTLKATLGTPDIDNDNTEYFSVTANALNGTVLDEAGGTDPDEDLVLTITSLKTPVSADETAEITVTLEATPTQ